jgi:hypothetical protein
MVFTTTKKNKRQVATVPHLLSDKQKRVRIENAKKLVKLYSNIPKLHSVTDDET